MSDPEEQKSVSSIASKLQYVHFKGPNSNKTLNYTGWPRKNATTLIVNFKDIINKNGFDFYFIMWKIHFLTK